MEVKSANYPKVRDFRDSWTCTDTTPKKPNPNKSATLPIYLNNMILSLNDYSFVLQKHSLPVTSLNNLCSDCSSAVP